MNLTKQILIAMVLAVVLGSITQVLLADQTLNDTLRYLL
jgi:hypothetical protein